VPLPGRPQMTAQISRAIEYPSGTGPGCGHRGAIRSGSATGFGLAGAAVRVQGTPGHPAGVTAGVDIRTLVNIGTCTGVGLLVDAADDPVGSPPRAVTASQRPKSGLLPGVGSRPKQLRRTQEPPPPRTPAAVRRWHGRAAAWNLIS